MNSKDFTEPQRQAILDLLVLAMYADGHLAAAEDARVQQWLTAMGCESEYERNRRFDAAVARVRPHSETGMAAASHAVALLEHFPEREERQRVHAALEDMMKSDNQVAAQESGFLASIREKLVIRT